MSENINNSAENDEISLKDLILKGKDLFRFLLKKWRIILIVGLLGGALGLVYSLIKKPEYVATLSFAVQEKSSSTGGGLAALAGQFGVNIGGGTESIFSGSNIIELLKSRKLLESTLLSKVVIDKKEQSLIDYYIDEIGLKEKWKKKNLPLISYPLNQKRVDFSREQDSALNVLTTDITFEKLNISKLSKETSITMVSFGNEDEQFAKLFTEILVKEVTDFYVQSRTELPRTNLIKMEANADSIKRELEALMLKSAINADRNLDAIRRVMGVSQQKDQIKMQLLGTIYAELAKNIEAMKMDLIRETPLIQIIDTPIYPLEKQRLGKAKGIIIGGFLGGFLIVAYLITALFYRKIMKGEDNPS